jgi:hypothetical protein
MDWIHRLTDLLLVGIIYTTYACKGWAGLFVCVVCSCSCCSSISSQRTQTGTVRRKEMQRNGIIMVPPTDTKMQGERFLMQHKPQGRVGASIDGGDGGVESSGVSTMCRKQSKARVMVCDRLKASALPCVLPYMVRAKTKALLLHVVCLMATAHLSTCMHSVCVCVLETRHIHSFHSA